MPGPRHQLLIATDATAQPGDVRKGLDDRGHTDRGRRPACSWQSLEPPASGRKGHFRHNASASQQRLA